MSTRQVTIKIHTYNEPAAGWEGYVEPKNADGTPPSWVLYFDAHGEATFFGSRVEGGAVVPGMNQASSQLAR